MAERTGVTQATIANIEIGKHEPSKSTTLALIRALEGAGIELLPDCVRQLKGVREFSGEDAVLRLFEDIYFSMRTGGGDLMISGADESKNPPGLERIIMKIRCSGVRMRILVEEGDTYLLAPLHEYRYIPSRYFVNNPLTIYGDRVAIFLPNQRRPIIQVVTNPALAASQRRHFEFLWDHCMAPNSSSVEQVYPDLED